MVGWHCSRYFRHYFFFDRLLFHRGRHCCISDCLTVWACAASCPGRGHHRADKLDCGNAHDYWHLCDCCRHIGTTVKKVPWAGENRAVERVVLRSTTLC